MRSSPKDTCVLIGMANSSHFHSWVLATIETGIFRRIVVFPSDIPRNWSDFRKNARSFGHTKVLFFRLLPTDLANYLVLHTVNLILSSKWRSWFISKILFIFKPRVVHYHEMQHSGYSLLPILSKMHGGKRSRPKIIGSTWGSDLKYFAYTDDHRPKINELLRFTDVVTAERADEIQELELFNYKGEFNAPVYISVGSNEDESTRETTPTSSRKLILVKGYQHDQGRALNALKALELSADELRGFQIRVFSSHKSPSVRYQVQIMRNTLGMDIDSLPQMDHKTFMNIFSKARIYIGLSETDGLSTSMVEAMKFGVFPIQSINSAAGLFIEHATTGFIVNPWDIDSIRRAISIGLHEETLINLAASTNKNKILKAYSRSTGLRKIKELYANGK